VALAILAAAVMAGCGSKGPAAQDPLKLCARFSGCEWNERTLGDLCALYTSYDQARARKGSADRELAALDDCLHLAKDCQQAQACWRAPAESVPSCSGQTGHGICSDGVALACGAFTDGSSSRSDCAAAGLTCVQDGLKSTCALSECKSGLTPPRCDQELLIRCDDAGLGVQAIDCSGYGSASCKDDLSGVAGCLGTGPACDPGSFVARCDGSNIVQCVGGYQATTDCSLLGSGKTCQPDTGGATVGCAPSAPDCQRSDPETCEAGVVGFCLDGKKTSLVCQDYGLTGCSTLRISGTFTARCN
jgi:hypothetical protein